MNPKLSIIVPVYNTEIYLKECLDSLVNQTFKDIEIIIVNDCSPDNSEAVILEYQAKDPRIKYIKHDKNLGLGGARNTGITNASGEWIAFVDSDDYIDLNTYKTMLSLMDKHKANLGMFSVVNFDDDTKEETYDPYFDCDIDTLTTINHQNFNRIKDGIVCNKIFKSSDITDNNITFPEHLKHEDEEFWFKYVAMVEPSVIGSNKKFYHYRQRSNSTMGQREVSRKDLPQICLNIYSFLQQNRKKELYRQFLLSSLVQYLYYHYEKVQPIYQTTFQEQVLQLFQNMEITKEELKQYSLLNLFYVDNSISPSNIKISIVIPIYNAEVYLKECLDSIINQTFKNIEIIIVNDCSPDNSETIVLEYMSKDPRIKYIKHEHNRSVLQARNTGITNATGDYIWCIDPDDYIPTLLGLQILVCTINSTQADVIQFKIEHSDLGMINWLSPLSNTLITDSQQIKDLYFDTMRAFNLASRIVTKDLYKKAIKNVSQDLYLNMAEDFFICSLIMNSAKSYIGIQDSLYFYRQHPSSSTNKQLTSELITNHIGNFQQILDSLSPTLNIKYTDIVQKELGLQSFARIMLILDTISPQELDGLLSLFVDLSEDKHSKTIVLEYMPNLLVYYNNLTKNKVDYLKKIRTLLTLNLANKKLTQNLALFYIYSTKQIDDDSVIFLAQLQALQQENHNLQQENHNLQQENHNLQHNKWYNFGQLSRKQKIKKIIVVLSKKLKIYPMLKKLYKIVRK